MPDNVTVSNSPTSSHTDIPVRTTETASGKHLQHVRLDLGTGSDEAQAEGSVLTSVRTVNSASTTSVAASATSVQLLASQSNRRGVILVNGSDKTAYVKFGNTASTTSYTYKLITGATVEFPSPVYTGKVDCIWESGATGSMYITDL
jgi:hypothetical protein